MLSYLAIPILALGLSEPAEGAVYKYKVVPEGYPAEQCMVETIYHCPAQYYYDGQWWDDPKPREADMGPREGAGRAVGRMLDMVINQ